MSLNLEFHMFHQFAPPVACVCDLLIKGIGVQNLTKDHV